jgi:hypothetical protein
LEKYLKTILTLNKYESELLGINVGKAKKKWKKYAKERKKILIFNTIGEE